MNIREVFFIKMLERCELIP